MAPVVYQSPWMNDELRMFRKSVRQFIEREFAPHQACWRQQHRPDVEAWTAAGGNGLLLPDVPDEYGGGGGDLAHQTAGGGGVDRERGGWGERGGLGGGRVI